MITWPSVFNTGIEEIDKQHRKLVELINNIFYNINSKSNKSEVLLIFRELYDYVKYHLRYEEAFMLEINYPDFDRHAALHAEFEDDLYDLQIQFENGEDLLSLRDKLVKFLMSWLLEHIVEEDSGYAKYFHLTVKDDINIVSHSDKTDINYY